MEYLLVHYPAPRRVKVDGEFNGVTGILIELEAGTHTITLDPPPNFEPAEQTIILKDTSALSPCEVTFAPKA